MGQGVMGLGMLIWRQVTPWWANDPLWLNGRSRGESGQWQVRAPNPRGKSGGGQRKAERFKNDGLYT